MFNLHFGGNPVVMQLLETPGTDIDKLLDIDSFPAEFRNCNPKLQKYMDIGKYNRLVEYITQIGDPDNRNRSYKYPIIAAEILSIDNSKTLQALLKQQGTVIQKIQTEEIWTEKEVDQCDSEYYSSESSKGGNKSMEDFFEVNDRQNIPPPDDTKQNKRYSIGSKRKLNEKGQNQSQERKSLGASSASITSDDFPFVEQETKKIKIKEVKTTKKMIQVKPLLHQLCQYFEKEINHTLTGYVTKVLELILKKNSRKILREIFTTKTHKALIKHLDSLSLCDFIVNILLCPESQAQNARQFFVGSLLKTLISNSHDEQKNMQNKSIFYILTQLMTKLDPQSSKWHMVLMLYLFQQTSFPKISSLIFEEKTTNKNKDTFGQLLIHCMKKLLNPIIINAPNTASSAIKTSEEQNIKQMRIKLISKFEACFKQFIDKAWQSLIEISEKQIPSYVYLRELEILNMLIKNNLYWSRMELSNQDKIFTILVQLCRKFSNNNFLHNQVFDLLKEIVHISGQFPSLFAKTFNCKTFTIFCLQTIASNISNPPMYKGQCIYLCQSIRHSTSQVALQFKEEHKQKWNKIQQAILTNVEKINATLGGFSMKRFHKTEIFFDKQAIYEKFGNFLRGEIPLKKEKSVQDEELQEIASQGSAQWSDWNQFSNYNADQVDQKDKQVQTKQI